MTIVVADIRSPAALAGLTEEWWALWSRCPSATPFQTPAWLISWWRAFAPGELFVVTARSAGRLVGLAPIYVEQSATGTRLLPLGISVSDYIDLLLDPQTENQAGRAIIDHVCRTDGGWGEWEIPELQAGACGARLACPEGFVDSTEAYSPCPVLALPDVAEDVRVTVPRRKLRKLRMARNRAGRRGEVRIVDVRADSAEAAFGILVDLHRARWRDRGESGVLADPRVRRFHQSALAPLAARDLLRMYELHIGERVVGVYYGFLHRAHAYAYLGGFDPDYARESPGTILLGAAIESAVVEGAREFHFLRGAESYKYEWGAVDRWNSRRCFRRAQAHVAA